jgi:hypothetical protein
MAYFTGPIGPYSTHTGVSYPVVSILLTAAFVFTRGTPIPQKFTCLRFEPIDDQECEIRVALCNATYANVIEARHGREKKGISTELKHHGFLKHFRAS